MSEQMIFKRYEIKYLLTKQQQAMIKEAMQPHMIPDVHGRNTTCSLYFDTPDYRLIRRSIEHPIYKEKLRLRSYGVASPDTIVYVELKKKYQSVVYKRRIGMTEAQAQQYLLAHQPVQNTQITREIDYCMNIYPQLAPSVMLSYQREAFYSRDDHDFRITFDDTILWRKDHLSLQEGIFGSPLLGEDQVLMEIKTATSIPLWMVKVLSENHIYKTSFSKYGSAYRFMAEKSDAPVSLPSNTPTTYQKKTWRTTYV